MQIKGNFPQAKRMKMLLKAFENAMQKHSSSAYAVRVSPALWRELATTERIGICHPTSWPSSCNDCPVVHFIGPLLIVIDSTIDIRGQQFFFLPKINALYNEKKSSTVLLQKEARHLDVHIATKARSPQTEGFLERHASRWMGRS